MATTTSTITQQHGHTVELMLQQWPEVRKRYNFKQALLIYDYYRDWVNEGHWLESFREYIRVHGDFIVKHFYSTAQVKFKEPQ